MKEYTIIECEQLFQNLFPNGLASSDIMAILAPKGWENSPFTLPIPPVEQAYQTAKARKSLNDLLASIEAGKVPKMDEETDFESFDSFKAHYTAETPNYTLELEDTMGSCLWDIFSDNNDVVKDNKKYHIGSFRGAAGFIADWLNQTSEKEYGYMDFYMGNGERDEAPDYTPVYELIFLRLKQLGCDWVFNFTQLGIVDFSKIKEQKRDKPEDYDPNKALEQELKEREEQKKKDALRAKIDEINAEARENALYKPPPKVVEAYRSVFGEFPIGWPPA